MVSVPISMCLLLAGLYYLIHDPNGNRRRSMLFGIGLWVISVVLLALAFMYTDLERVIRFYCLVFSVIIGLYGIVFFFYNPRGDTYDETFFGPGRYEEPASVPESNTVDKNISDISLAIQGRGTQSGSSHDGAPNSWGSDPRFATSEIRGGSSRKGD